MKIFFLFLCLLQSGTRLYPEHSGESGWPKELTGARLVYETPEGIVLKVQGREARLWIKGARWPRWSKNGNAVFFIRGKEIGWKEFSTGKETMILSMKKPSVLAVYDAGGEVWVAEGNKVKAVSPGKGTQRLIIEDDTFREIDVGPDGKTTGGNRPRKEGRKHHSAF